MPSTLQERLAKAFSQIINPRTGAGVYESQQLRDIATTVDGKVRATLTLDASDDPSLARQVRRAIESVPGVSGVQLEVRSGGHPARPAGRWGERGRAGREHCPARGARARPPGAPGEPHPARDGPGARHAAASLR